MDAVAVQRFWQKVQKTDACWLWTAAADRYGYGVFWYSGKQHSAHRISWTLEKGIPSALCVLHTCDVRRCVNPEHLFLGTNLDNIKDRDSKGRTAKGAKSGHRTHPESIIRGAKHPRTHLTDEDVAAIRASTATWREITQQFSIARANLWRIRVRKSWAHLK